MFSVHWTPHHRGTFGPYEDRAVFAAWQPPFVKLVWDGSQPPYLEDLPSSARIIWRNYPLSEQFHSGLNLGTPMMRALSADAANLASPQNGSGRDQHDQQRAVTAASDLPTPEQAAEAYVQNAIEVSTYCTSKGIARDRLLFEGPNEYPVWSHGYDGLARLETARLNGLHKAGLHGVVLNLGVGWPGNTGPDTPPVWNWAAPVIASFTTGDYLGLHEYWAFQGPGQNWGWWAGRVLACPFRVPVLMTECGIDAGVLGTGYAKQGYYDLPGNTFDEKVNRYQDELWDYAQRLHTDGRTKGLLIYTYDGNRTDWGRMDIRSEQFIALFLKRVQTQGLPVAGTIITPPTPPPPVVPTLADLLKTALGAQFSDLRTTLLTSGSYATRATSTIKRIIIHHTATVQTTWSNVARYHVQTKGWPGIGYHFGITPDGKVAYLGDINTIRYHAGDANTNSLGICFMGNFVTDTPTTAALNAYAQLRATLEKFLGRTLIAFGHRDVGLTVCPGDKLYEAILAPVANNLAVELLATGAARDLVTTNPTFALAKAILAAGLLPTSPEFTLQYAGWSYTCQVGRKPGGPLQVFYCLTGQWDRVETVSAT